MCRPRPELKSWWCCCHEARERRNRESGRSPMVLFVADFFHPVHDLAVECFLNRNVRHGCCRRSTMPVLQSGREPDHVAGTNFLDEAALALRPTATACDNERLTERMRVPRSARARLERDARTGGPCRSVCLKQRIDAHRAGEPISRTFGGRL